MSQITIRVPIPGRPYSQIEASYAPDEAVDTAELLRVLGELATAEHDEGEPGEQEQQPQQQRSQATRPQGAPATRQHTSLYCAEHNVELVLSAAKYQTYDEGPNGERVPAKFFCPGDRNGTGANHTVYRSRAVAAP